MSISMYLTFDGNCREAFEFYRSVFQTEFQVLQTFGDAPEDMKVSESLKNQTMHVSMPIGTSVLMGSDHRSESSNLVIGNNFSVSVETESKEQTDDVLAKLSTGGNVTMPAQKTFWGSYFGSCTDKFGVNWMVSCELAA